MKKSTNKRAFTLVELLVVISIIAILAGLSFPAITAALAKARQGADVSNARQIGTILFTYASDNNFKYPSHDNVEDYMQELIDGGYLTDYSILVTSGSDQEPWDGQGTIGGDNISYGVMTRGTNPVTDNAHDQLPLLFSRDSGLTAPSAGAVTSLTAVALSGDGPWGIDGVAVFRKGNSAQFLKAKEEKINTDNNNAWIPIGFKDSRTDYAVATPAGGGEE